MKIEEPKELRHARIKIVMLKRHLITMFYFQFSFLTVYWKWNLSNIFSKFVQFLAASLVFSKTTFSRKSFPVYFFNLCFLSQPFKNHRTAGEGWITRIARHYHSHLSRRHLEISWAINAGNSPLHIGSNRTRTGYLGFSASR